MVDGFARRPRDFARRVAGVFADLGAGAHVVAFDRLEALIVETRALTSR